MRLAAASSPRHAALVNDSIRAFPGSGKSPRFGVAPLKSLGVSVRRNLVHCESMLNFAAHLTGREILFTGGVLAPVVGRIRCVGSRTNEESTLRDSLPSAAEEGSRVSIGH